MSENDKIASAQLESQELDELLTKFGRLKVAQEALDSLPQLRCISKAARVQLRHGIVRVQTGCYDPRFRIETFADMVQVGKSVITAKTTKVKLEEILYDAMIGLRDKESDKLERSGALATAR